MWRGKFGILLFKNAVKLQTDGTGQQRGDANSELLCVKRPQTEGTHLEQVGMDTQPCGLKVPPHSWQRITSTSFRNFTLHP